MPVGATAIVPASSPRGLRGNSSDHAMWGHLLHTGPYTDAAASELARLTKETLQEATGACKEAGYSVQLTQCTTIEEQRANALTLNTQLRTNFSLVTPSASSKHLACKYCFASLSGNSTRAKIHLALCPCCPDETRIIYAQPIATKFESIGARGDITPLKGRQCGQFLQDYAAKQNQTMKRTQLMLATSVLGGTRSTQ